MNKSAPLGPCADSLVCITQQLDTIMFCFVLFTCVLCLLVILACLSACLPACLPTCLVSLFRSVQSLASSLHVCPSVPPIFTCTSSSSPPWHSPRLSSSQRNADGLHERMRVSHQSVYGCQSVPHAFVSFSRARCLLHAFAGTRSFLGSIQEAEPCLGLFQQISHQVRAHMQRQTRKHTAFYGSLPPCYARSQLYSILLWTQCKDDELLQSRLQGGDNP